MASFASVSTLRGFFAWPKYRSLNGSSPLCALHGAQLQENDNMVQQAEVRAQELTADLDLAVAENARLLHHITDLEAVVRSL